MDKTKAVQVIEKYKKVSDLLGLKDDDEILEDILNFIKSSENTNNSFQINKQNKYGESDFKSIISNEITDISVYDIDANILTNKDKIIEFWHSLNDEGKNRFTIFELNIILYLISKQYNKYQKKEKKRIVATINAVVKDKRMDNSYNNLVV